MPPFAATASPASAASSLLGRTPMATSARSAGYSPASVLTAVSLPSPSFTNSVTGDPMASFTPLARRCLPARRPISSSRSAGMIQSSLSIIVTWSPLSTRASAISIPISPAPTRTTFSTSPLSQDGVQPIGIPQRVEGLHTRGVDARNRRCHRTATRSQNQLVVGEGALRPGLRVPGAHGLLLAIDGDRFLLAEDLDALSPSRRSPTSRNTPTGVSERASILSTMPEMK